LQYLHFLVFETCSLSCAVAQKRWFVSFCGIDLIDAYVVVIEFSLQSIDIVAKLWLEFEGIDSFVG